MTTGPEFPSCDVCSNLREVGCEPCLACKAECKRIIAERVRAATEEREARMIAQILEIISRVNNE